MKKIISKLIMLLVLGGMCLPAVAQEQSKKPNIIFILADDFGYGSVNSYGADKNLVRTPHIDGLAEDGMRFTNASTPGSVCTPTRYGILTGRYPWRSSLKFGTTSPMGALLPDPNRMTIADLLKGQGYNTTIIGKWHLGFGKEAPVDLTGKLTPGPLDLGFDYYFGVPQNHSDYHGVYVENDHIYGLRSKKVSPYSKTFTGSYYKGYDAPQRVNEDVMGDLTNKSIDWIRQQDSDKPFFLYFSAVAVHTPITPSDYMRGMSDCGAYGDFIQDMDHSVGKIIETLEYMNLMENTIIIFTSDNGGVIHPSNKPDSPQSQTLKYGLKVNGDLRGRKQLIYEGGTRVPFIISWPGKIEAGSVSDDMINLVDMFATVGDITRNPLPKSKDIAPDSYSFLPSLINTKNSHPRTFMVTADGNGMHAIRQGDWKYIDDTPPEGLPEAKLKDIQENFKPQLYNLADDPYESLNLYDENPKTVKKLSKELNRIRKQAH